MSDDQAQTISDEDRHGFAETPSQEEWLGLLRDLSEDLDAMELRIEHIRTHELAPLEAAAKEMRERIDMIRRRLSR